jgi:acyl-CoA dehydrogenase
MIVDETAELRELRAVTRQFLADLAPHAAVERKQSRVDRALWTRACTELGFAGVAVPEEHGGLGIGMAGLAIVCEEAGRALAALPLPGSVVAAQSALLLADDPAVLAGELPGLLAGDHIAALALADGPGQPAPADPTTARRDGDGWRLDGTKWFVADGCSADRLLVTAATPDGLTLFLVDATAPGLTRDGVETMDLTRDVARITLAGTPARVVGRPGGWQAIAHQVRLLQTVAVACECLGGAQRCLDDAVEYARLRVQFGRPIGSFQAIKHRCADLAADVDDARSAVLHAVWAADQCPDELPAAAALAAAVSTQAYLTCSAENVQIHGGIGFTWEHTAHLHVRRARTAAALSGGPRRHREDLLAAMGI